MPFSLLFKRLQYRTHPANLPYTPVTPAKPTWNRPQTDKNPQIRGEIGLQSVLIRFCRFGVGLCSGRQICRWEIFQTCLKDLSPTNCRLSVGYMSVWCRFCRGAFGDVSVLIRPPMVDGFIGLRSVIYRAYVGRPDTDSRPNQDRTKSDITPSCVESADTFPNQNRRVPDISRTQIELHIKEHQKFRNIFLHQSGATRTWTSPLEKKHGLLTSIPTIQKENNAKW